jgi:1,4-dihydroxy-2-naphthoate octaprenyltransferase
LLTISTAQAKPPAAIIACTGRTPKELILSLQLTSMAALTFGLGLGAAFAF